MGEYNYVHLPEEWAGVIYVLHSSVKWQSFFSRKESKWDRMSADIAMISMGGGGEVEEEVDLCYHREGEQARKSLMAQSCPTYQC